MNRILTLIALAAVSACAAPVTAPAPATAPAAEAQPVLSAKARFVTALENNGCVLNETTTAKVLTEANVNADEVTQIVAELSNEGRAEISGGASIRIMSDRCI